MDVARQEFHREAERLRVYMANRDRWLFGIVISALVGIIILLVRPYLPPPDTGNVAPPAPAVQSDQ